MTSKLRSITVVYLYSLFPDERHRVTEAVGYLREDLITDGGLLKMVYKVLHLQQPHAVNFNKTESLGISTFLTCCSRFSLVALSLEENSLTTHGTIFF